MKTISTPLPRKFSADSRKALAEKLCHVSAAIREIAFRDGDSLEVRVDESEPEASVTNKMEKLVQRFAEYDVQPAERILHSERGCPGAALHDPTGELEGEGAIAQLGDGLYAITGIALDLFDYFDARLQEVGSELGAQEYRFPTLIPIRAMQRIQYLASRPEYLNFVSHLRRDLDAVDSFSSDARGMTETADLGGRAETDCINSVAVCLQALHCFHERDLGRRPLVVGAVGKCMRYEPGAMYSLRRLRDFTMREIVCLGGASEVQEFRKRALGHATALLAEWGLRGHVGTANDTFFTRDFAPQSVFQKRFELKYEIRAEVDAAADSLAIASINDHRDFLGKGFGVRAEGAPAYSACLGYGLERCVYAFLAQHGRARSNWPDAVARRVREGGGLTVGAPSSV
jgi:seryl-tRNA synthetase